MGKATDALEQLSQLPPEDRQVSKPELRLKPEAIVESQDPSINEGLQSLERKESRNILVRDPASGAEAVLVPVERYVSLVGVELASNPHKVAVEGGRLEPSGLAESEVEQVDPSATWSRVG